MKSHIFDKQKDVAITSIDDCYSGFCKIHKFQLSHRLFDGEWSKTLERELSVRPRVAAAIPYDPSRDELLLIEQFRVGALQLAYPWLLEFVAGVADREAEDPLEIIDREMQEEAGIKALALKKIYDYLVSPGGSNEYLTLYCAKIDSSQAGGIHGSKDEGEDIFVHVLKTKEAFELLANGKINNSLTIIGLQWLQLHKTRLDAEWGD